MFYPPFSRHFDFGRFIGKCLHTQMRSFPHLDVRHIKWEEKHMLLLHFCTSLQLQHQVCFQWSSFKKNITYITA